MTGALMTKHSVLEYSVQADNLPGPKSFNWRLYSGIKIHILLLMIRFLVFFIIKYFVREERD